MSYRFEMHTHTAEVSLCATCKAHESVALLKEAGYAGTAITNHYIKGYFDNYPGDWPEQAAIWLSSYRLAKQAGDAQGLAVVLGVELEFTCDPGNHYLSYGMEEEFFIDTPRLFDMTPEEYAALAKQKGFYFAQAHPLRAGRPADPAILDGMEIFNGHWKANNRNGEVYELVRQNGLIPTVGSDFHHPYQLGTTAMLFPTLPATSAELARLLFDRRIDGYEVKVPEHQQMPDAFLQDPRFSCGVSRPTAPIL